MRAEPGRFADMAARSVGAIWRAYDLQLTVYAALLARVRARDGVHEQRRGGPAGPRRSAPTFQRALMWSGIAIVVYLVATAFDYRWLKTLALADLLRATSACSW